MEQLLIMLVVLIVAALVIFALLRWAGINISPVVMQVAGYIVVGVFLIIVIRLLWPLLVGGDLPSLQ